MERKKRPVAAGQYYRKLICLTIAIIVVLRNKSLLQNLQEIIAAITRKNGSRPKPTSRGYSMCCPGHNDERPSFSIAEDPNGTILMKCFSRGCTIDEMCSAIGIKVNYLFSQKVGVRRG